MTRDGLGGAWQGLAWFGPKKDGGWSTTTTHHPARDANNYGFWHLQRLGPEFPRAVSRDTCQALYEEYGGVDTGTPGQALRPG